MTAKVVFSDGSKTMAHNLDDLYERWMLRRQEERSLYVHPIEFPEQPDYRKPSTWEQAEAWYVEVSDQCRKIHEQLTALKNGKPTMPRAKLLAQRETLIAESKYKESLSTFLKSQVKQFRITEVHKRQTNWPEDEYTDNLRQLYYAQKKELQQARRRIAELEAAINALRKQREPYEFDS